MAKTTKKKEASDPKAVITAMVDARKAILTKNRGKAQNDPKRRLAHKRLKRAQRALGKIEASEKRIAAAAAKKVKTE